MFLALIAPILWFSVASGGTQSYLGLQNSLSYAYAPDSYTTQNGGGLGTYITWNGSTSVYSIKTASQNGDGNVELFKFGVTYLSDTDNLKVQFLEVKQCNYKFGVIVDCWITSNNNSFVDESFYCWYDALEDKPIDDYILVEGPSDYTYVRFRIAYTYYSEDIYNAVSDKGYSKGFTDGYNKGREDYEDTDAEINSIFEGMLSIGLLPIEFFLSIFNFEIFGINLTSIVSAILSLCVILILLRYVLGGKSQ